MPASTPAATTTTTTDISDTCTPITPHKVSIAEGMRVAARSKLNHMYYLATVLNVVGTK